MSTIDIKINKDSSVPLYLQIKKQIINLLKRNILKVGDKMPTERELSDKLKVSRNTISTAYNELEQEGILRSYQGRGTFVEGELNVWKIQNIKQKIIKFIDLGFEEAVRIGMDVDEFLEVITQRVREKRDFMSKVTAIYVECNIEQAEIFGKQLMENTDMNIISITLEDISKGSNEINKAIEKSQVIITTFNHVSEVTMLAKKFQKEIIGVSINVDLETIVKIARYPEETKFAFICISNEFMFKARGALEKAGLHNINMQFTNTMNKQELLKIINSSDVLVVSPGRYKDVKSYDVNHKHIMKFLYNVDDNSIRDLKSKIIELKYNK
ncbi:GntR family transcriptional regulator [Clostridium kluyveri]|uniref:GntR family transcriptional regulator n=1 Tax=Clostridium kluyveri TaxID=1534 RepID=A0A1L5F3R7_CLOKL|nr:GntR family transcriptional regulator [Clostridium kluyveri]APM37592.1 GntR family transcriptional regulator [Clostridium kluyveri]